MNFKCRAWDKKDKRMITDEQDFIPIKVTNKGVLKLSPHHEEDLWSFIIEDDRFELMLSSGVTDRNGVEIYDGDIIRWHDEITSEYQITYVNGVFCLDGMPDSNFYHHREDIKTKWEVVSNIHSK